MCLFLLDTTSRQQRVVPSGMSGTRWVLSVVKVMLVTPHSQNLSQLKNGPAPGGTLARLRQQAVLKLAPSWQNRRHPIDHFFMILSFFWSFCHHFLIIFLSLFRGGLKSTKPFSIPNHSGQKWCHFRVKIGVVFMSKSGVSQKSGPGSWIFMNLIIFGPPSRSLFVTFVTSWNVEKSSNFRRNVARIFFHNFHFFRFFWKSWSY